MKTHTISKLGRMFGLSRSTLLYYDRIGLLTPSVRTESGYRLYTEDDVERLQRICSLRRTSLSLNDIGSILASETHARGGVVEKRLQEIGSEISDLKAKQELLGRMLKGMASYEAPVNVDKQMWVEMLRTAGMDEQGITLWHAEFEHRAPEAHRDFLLSLGMGEKEVDLIRQWSRKNRTAGGTAQNGR
jgi:MerR family transcriptional regulator, thiopeptide resistance regulator